MKFNKVCDLISFQQRPPVGCIPASTTVQSRALHRKLMCLKQGSQMSFSLMKCSEMSVLTTTTSRLQFQLYQLIFCHLLRTYLRCRGISRVANRVAIAIYLLPNKSLKLCCRNSIDVNGSNPFHVIGSISHIADVNNMQMICIAYISEIISLFSKFLFQMK